jgi:hypothetical protein
VKKLAICLPQTETVRNEYARSLAEMVAMLSQVDAGLDDMFLISGMGSLLPALRHKLAVRAIEERGATHLLWIDSDHRFPVDTGHRLLAHDRPFVGINGTTRAMPIRYTAAKTETDYIATTERSKGLEKVRRIGFGIVLIEARVFEAVPKPWFLIEYAEKDGEAYYRGEDVYFCEKARQYGFVPMVDHDLTKQTEHIGSVGWKTCMIDPVNPKGFDDEA